MDFNALQHKLFALDPSDPAEDLRKLTESAGGEAQKSAASDVNYVQESVEVAEGSLGLDKDYSVADFAALAGVTLTEAQKKGSAGQLKGKDSLNKLPAGTNKNATRDKLVGEGFQDGWDDAHKLSLFKKMAKVDSKSSPTDNTTSKQKSTSTPAAKVSGSDWKSFLKQHTTGLQAIAADPKKRKRFDTWMAKWNEDIEEDIEEDNVESIKEMLMRKLEAKK